MAFRPEIVANLQKQGANGGILLNAGAGSAARTRVEDLTQQVDKARANLLSHELATAYRVTIFGSSRPQRGTPDYNFARDLSREIVEVTGADIITGGGPGIMTAALEGASLAGNPDAARGVLSNSQGTLIEAPASDILAVDSTSHKAISDSRRIGIGIQLPFEQGLNGHVTHGSQYKEFMPRIQHFVDMSHGAYIAPGGIGSALEFAALLQLKQVEHLESDFPVVAHPFWERTVRAMEDTMYYDRVEKNVEPFINEGDVKVVFSAEIPEIVDIFAAHHTQWQNNIGSKVRRTN